MPRSRAVVGAVADISGPPAAAGTTTAEHVTVRLESGESARVSLADPRGGTWLSVLDDLRRAGIPAYLELQPDSDVVSEVLVPLRVTVTGIETTDSGAEVELTISQARHQLRRDNPDFDELLTTLRQARADGATVLVTEDLAGTEIIDVRVLPKGPLLPPVEREPTEDLGVQAVSLSQAQQMFDLCNGRTCCSNGPSAPCIPFTYPDDGCWGRAHEMRRLMSDAGVASEKIWIYGSLRVATSNNPRCQVQWGWHVAPVLRVATGTTTQVYVIDPSLFPGPVPQTTWTGVQGDPAATTVITPSEVFHRTYGGSVTYDPTYAQTTSVLTTYRAQLQLRSAGSDGPPPYPQCMVRPRGVQWFGTIEGNTSRRWFTFGWPAAWHVVWSIMPLTICPGAPALTWSVAVERADSGNATYWITVRNLTARTVRFEGRYDVLSR